METITNMLSYLALEEEVKYLEVKDDLYSYEGTISKLDISTIKPTRISFKALPNQCFWWSKKKQLPENIQVGSKIEIQYEEHLVNTYSRFWIKNIKLIEEKENTLYKRKNHADLQSEEQSPSIRCSNNNCGKLLYLTDSKRCDGVIQKKFWGKYSYCDKCNSFSEDTNIGNRCIRETILCDDCKSIRNI